MTLKRARALAYKMLSARARTCRQIRDALHKKGADEETAATVLAELTEAGYVNDREFAVRAVDVKLESKACGPRYLQAVLDRAGVDRSVANEIIGEALPYQREYELAADFVRTLLNRGETCPQKAKRKLANRGFSVSVTHRAVEEEFRIYLDIML